MKKMLLLLGSMAALVGAAYGDRYTGEHPHGAEWGLVDALHPLNDYGIFRKMPDGMRSGGNSSGVRTGVAITYPNEPIVVDNTATGQNRGDDIDKIFYYSTPAWAPAEIYQTEIYGQSTVTVGGLVPNASYIAEIHFAETYNANQNRVFRSRANGTTIVCGVKPSAAGMGVAHTFATNVTANASGQVVFEITNYADNGIFGGYAIWGAAVPSWTDPAIVGDGSAVKMTWSDPHDVLRYYVYSADSAEGPWTELEVLMPGVSSYTIPSAYNPTIEKYWRVVASNGVGTVTCQAKLGDASAVAWTDLATLGATVASDATANYRVASAGTGGLNALGATTTEAAMYVNGYTDAHTLAIGAGETLKVGTLGVNSGAGDMTVGDTVGQGTVSPLGGTLTFDVKDAASTLTVNAVAAKVANSDSIVKFGPGAAKLVGGTDITSVSIGEGSVELPNAANATLAQTLSGAGTFVKSGAGTLTVANENPNFAGTFEVKEGTVLIGRTDAYKSFGDGVATIKVDSGATLDVGMPGAAANSLGLRGTKIVFEGTGDNGQGALANTSGADQYNAFARGEMTGDATVNSVARFDFRNTVDGAYFNMNGHVLTKKGGNLFLFTSVPVYAGADTAKIRIEQGTFGVESGTTFNGNGTVEFAGGAFDVYNLGQPLAWPITVTSAGGKFVCRSGAANQNEIAGTVTLEEGAELKLSPNDNTNFRITGKITGAGKLVRDEGGDAGYARIENTGNDWTGGTEVKKGILYCPCAAVLPGYNVSGKVVISGTGKIAVKLGSGGDDGWSAEQIGELMANADAPEGAKGSIMIDTAGYDAASGTGTVNKPIGIAKTGEGTFTAEMEYTAGGGIYADQGTLVISNNAANTMTGLQVVKKGRVEIYDSEIDFGNNNLNIGNVRSDGDIPTVVVGKGAYIHSYLAPYNQGSPSLSIGSADVAGGILEVQDGGVVSNKLYMGNNQYSQSAVLQSGGEIVNWGGAASDTVFANAQWTWGYWEVAGTGSATFMGYSQLTRNANAYATLAIRDDSSVIITNALAGSLVMSRGGHGAFDQSGGTLTTAGQLIFGDDSNNSGGNGVYEMRGGTANIGGEKSESVLVSDRPAFKGQINFTGGEFAAKNLYRNTRENPNTAYATFNGGTLKAKQGGTQLFGEASGNKLDGVYVFEKGAQFDTDGHNVTPGQALRAPQGLGVKFISWTQTDAAKLKWKGSELMGPPMVIIEGDGEGATAVVDFDTATRTVKGIIVTCPGWGYTEKPTVKLFGGGLYVDNNTQTYTIDAAAIIMGESSSGPIVKKGAGTLTLEGANGVAGAEVQGGVLFVPEGASIQPGKLTLAGGTFSAPSYAATELVVNGGEDDVSTLDAQLTISGERGSARLPGLYAAFKNGDLDTTFTAAADDYLLVVTNLEYAQTSIPEDYKIFEYEDYVNKNLNCAYDGYIWNRTGETVTWTFAEHFDDFVYLKIDDTVVLNDCENNAWTRPTFGSITLTPGPHRFHLVVYQGGGTSGPCTNDSWLNWWQKGGWAIGVDFQGRNEGVYENFVALEDAGDGELFTLTTDDLVVEDFAPEAYVHVNGGTLRLAPTVGLYGGFIPGGNWKTSPSPRTCVDESLGYANTAYEETAVLDGLQNKSIGYVYEGYIWNHDSTDVTWTFAENFDDGVLLTIDGTEVLNNEGWGTPTKANYTLTPGAHAIRIGLWQGEGGSGPSSQGWLSLNYIGIGVDFSGRNEEQRDNYVPLAAYAAGADKPILTTVPTLSGSQKLPANTSFAIANGAKVDLGGTELTLSGDFYSAAGAFTNGTLAVSGNWMVDLADIVEGNALTGDSFDFTGATITLTGNTNLLDRSVFYTLATATGSITGIPSVEGAPKGWSAQIRGRRLVLRPRGGLRVSLR